MCVFILWEEARLSREKQTHGEDTGSKQKGHWPWATVLAAAPSPCREVLPLLNWVIVFIIIAYLTIFWVADVGPISNTSGARLMKHDGPGRIIITNGIRKWNVGIAGDWISHTGGSVGDAAGSITEGAQEMKPIGSVHRVALKGLPVQLW